MDEPCSHAFQHEVVRASVVANGLAEAQVPFPSVPIMICENRKLAQEWTCWFLAAVYADREEDASAAEAVSGLAEAKPLPPREPTSKEIRAWALEHGYEVSDRGRVPADVRAAFLAQWKR